MTAVATTAVDLILTGLALQISLDAEGTEREIFDELSVEEVEEAYGALTAYLLSSLGKALALAPEELVAELRSDLQEKLSRA